MVQVNVVRKNIDVIIATAHHLTWECLDKMTKWKCNLCTMELQNDDDIKQRKERHEVFHKEYRIKNLNHGIVKWSEVNQ